MTTTPKKAPTASEALRELRSRMHERGGMLRSDIRDLIAEAITAAERAEAEAAQEPGDSVEALMESNPGMPGSEGRYALLYWPTSALDHERYLAAPVNDVSGVLDALHSAIGSGRTALAALRDARSKHAPAAPDATWLDTATFEEMEEWLPGGADILELDGEYWVSTGRDDEWPDRPTRTESVRAFLQARPELWKDRR